MEEMSTQEQQLCVFLKDLPRIHKNRYKAAAENELIQNLFWSLAGGSPDYLRLFFPDHRRPLPNSKWELRKAQGGDNCDNFTEAARGKSCGHIFKSGEATYRCKTCGADDTCVLCSRCYDSSDHSGHMVYVSVSLGNSGCCDCGDPEAWRLPVHCAIHTAFAEGHKGKDKGKAPALPDDLTESIRMTIGRVFDYICDVISCSPEQLRLPKSKESILLDEQMSRLTSEFYGRDIMEENCEFALLLWNDEKHTVNEVRDQVARACKVPVREGLNRAHETDDIGRSIIKYGYDVDELLKISEVIEQIKVTVTIRSARDTFREQMCGTIIEWLSDISGCSVGSDHDILRRVICEEMLKPWSTGSQASNANIGKKGIDDHEKEDPNEYRDYRLGLLGRQEIILRAVATAADPESDSDESEALDLDEVNNDEDDDELESLTLFAVTDERMMATVDETEESEIHVDTDLYESEHNFQATEGPETDAGAGADGDGDIDMTDTVESPPLEELEAIIADYPPLPQPIHPPAPPRATRDRDVTPSDSDTAENQPLIPRNIYAKSSTIPRTPHTQVKPENSIRPSRYWLKTPESFANRKNVPPQEDLWSHLRLDWMILFDLRMWKKVRIGLRDLYISTVVSISEFKRVLGLRFAGLYTTLAQLYLIADREPDHSIINISLQMLNTPSITCEIVDRRNFLTNLMAILYTFLTTRQVGHPYEVNPNATLAFDSGSVTNRRMYHFFMDLRYLFGSEYVRKKLRTDDRYTMQFLDLVKLHQGICPNVRAVGEHVEYETDAWISASLITREINRLCRQFSESFKWDLGENYQYISKAIRTTAKYVILNSIGAERKRFAQSEIKDEIRFKTVDDYEFVEKKFNCGTQYSVVKFSFESQPISFHHALHYTLSWLIEYGRHMTQTRLTNLLHFTTSDLFQKPRAMGQRLIPSQKFTPEDLLMAAFDYPLRVCAWLAQMKAGMWVRNGMSLRHQMSTYRGVNQRDVSHHRDIFLLQTAMVVCPPARVLVSAIDRYNLEHWMKGIYEQQSDGLEDGQVLDVVEDLIHLLIVIISDRTSLACNKEEPNSHVLAMRRDIIHVLCFKPLAFSDICNKLPDKFQDQEECQEILDEMTTFKPPEGLSDVGTFELKEQYLEYIDPYIINYNKNQREEAENAYKNWMAKKTKRAASEIVFEPKLPPIESGAFSDLAAFTRTGIFAQIIYYSLLYSLKAQDLTPSVPVTRVEAFLQAVLHLVLIAISEDKSNENEDSESSDKSFVHISLTRIARSNFIRNAPSSRTIATVLEILSRKEEYKACHPKISLALQKMKSKRQRAFETAFGLIGVPIDRISAGSPGQNNATEDRERKKQAALERQAKVIAQFQEQQKIFLDNQENIDWGEEESNDSEVEQESEDKDQKTYFPYPSGTCILCQEETKDGRLYGTFALMMNSNILRQTEFNDPDYMRELTKIPSSLDRSAEKIRPFGVASENREKVIKLNSTGDQIQSERYSVGKGFPSASTITGPVSTGCGHIMHFKCFAVYYGASHRRHQHQIARHHPENLKFNEFVCPLCKALGNAFLPIIWSPKREVPLSHYKVERSFEDWVRYSRSTPRLEAVNSATVGSHCSRALEYFMEYNKRVLPVQMISRISELLLEAWGQPVSPQPHQISAYNDMGVNPSNRTTGPAGLVSNANYTNLVLSPLTELVESYRGLTDTMRKNKLPTVHKFSNYVPGQPGQPVRSNIALQNFETNDVIGSDTLAKILAFSISAVEIQQRGVATLPGTTFLETVPQQALIHLRILAETASSVVSISGIRAAGDNVITQEFSDDYENQAAQLFLHARKFTSSDSYLLGQDIFVFLTECSLCLVPIDNMDILLVVRLCYLAELVKVAIKMERHAGSNSPYRLWLQRAMHEFWSAKSSGSPLIGSPFRNFCSQINEWTVNREDWTSATHLEKVAIDQPCFDGEQSYRAIMRKYALTFLRKVVLLLHVHHGILFHNQTSISPDADELDRLTEALQLPHFDQMCCLENSPNLASLIEGWISQIPPATPDSWNSIFPISLSHPAIFELVGLPKNYDVLMEETMKRRCPTTGKDISDPMLCLFCGVIICGQSVCCLKQGERGGRTMEIGGGQQHIEKCQKNIALFLNIRKCCVFYAHNISGSWMVAPYINKYGEVDPGLRHSRQLFLNQKRYDALLRNVWLGHGIPSVVSRKLEMDINNGGWETI
ncbi:E3 ubiquitin-protein ligase [Podosphaera aphanis]|nr:E3 ubiquitin-protein ligase [Podosphaera aphanis]